MANELRIWERDPEQILIKSSEPQTSLFRNLGEWESPCPLCNEDKPDPSSLSLGDLLEEGTNDQLLRIMNIKRLV